MIGHHTYGVLRKGTTIALTRINSWSLNCSKLSGDILSITVISIGISIGISIEDLGPTPLMGLAYGTFIVEKWDFQRLLQRSSRKQR